MYAETQLKVVHKEDTEWINCSACQRRLMCVTGNTPTEEILYNVVVDCPHCGDKSFNYAVYGPLKNIPAEGVQLINVRQDGKVMHFLTKKVATK